MRFRAAVLREPRKRLAVETIEAGDLQPNEVVVRVAAAGLCHTDLEVIDGQLAYPMPIVLGHETAGVIEDVGSAVSPKRRGERVVLSWNPHCGHCFHCERGQPILCETYVANGPQAVQFDGTTRLRLGSAPLRTMFYIAGFAEYAIVTDGCAIAMPADMPLDRACLIGCGVMTGVGAAINIAKIGYGDAVMVIGCGAVGLSAIQGARLAGATTILAVDRNRERLALARQVGANHVAVVPDDDAPAIARSLTDGRGVDCVLESAGNAPAFRLSAEACRTGGQIVWLGKTGVNEEVAFRWGSLMGEKRIVRSSYGGARPARDFPRLARAYLDGKLQLDPYLTRRLQLEEINAGFDDLKAGRGIRSVIVFDR
ncbi:Zn-dependent alcohol dehydrogenase [Reyranella sp.]|jgi:S-(hydroxymethyl)glutathione dehydrogenase/alcohol dehydrogenase|uniref:Zn-dependent alcohol dehydrogenase n=1 Tax=Reyranella sp. TaxID=1929291 RepID=UPI002F95B9F5